MSSASSATWLVVPPSTPPDSRIMSGPQVADARDLLVRLALVVAAQHVHHDRARAQGRALGGLGRHRAHDAGHEHLQAAARAARREVEVDALLALLRHEDRAVLADEAPAAQLLDLGHGVDHAHGHVVEGRLDGRRRLAARDEPPALGPVLDEDGLGRGAARSRWPAPSGSSVRRRSRLARPSPAGVLGGVDGRHERGDRLAPLEQRRDGRELVGRQRDAEQRAGARGASRP
jgi:hypothetical protein